MLQPSLFVALGKFLFNFIFILLLEATNLWLYPSSKLFIICFLVLNATRRLALQPHLTVEHVLTFFFPFRTHLFNVFFFYNLFTRWHAIIISSMNTNKSSTNNLIWVFLPFIGCSSDKPKSFLKTIIIIKNLNVVKCIKHHSHIRY